MLLFFGDYSDYLIFLNCIKNLNWRLTNEVMGDCGVAGVVAKDGSTNIVPYLYTMEIKLQRRGELSCGMLLYDSHRPKKLRRVVGAGLVGAVFKEHENLFGTQGIGHVRYATSGPVSGAPSGRRMSPGAYQRQVRKEAQPFFRDHEKRFKRFGFAFNGNLTNVDALTQLCIEQNYDLETKTDTELLKNVIALSIYQETKDGTGPPDIDRVFNRVVNYLKLPTDKIHGSFAILFLNAMGEFSALADPYKNRPLCYAEDDKIFAVASETIALQGIGLTNWKFVEPGQMLTYGKKGLELHDLIPSSFKAHCMFEWVYFSHVNSDSEAGPISLVRKRLGRELAVSEPLRGRENIVVAGAPETARVGADAFAKACGWDYIQEIFTTSIYGRGFTEPERTRDAKMDAKYDVNIWAIKGKELVTVDDSIVRLGTLKRLAWLAYSAGAAGFHPRSMNPPTKHPCYYGIDFPDPKELIANRFTYSTIDELESKIAETLTLSIKERLKLSPEDKLPRPFSITVKYQTHEGLLSAIKVPRDQLCLACINGDYRIPFQESMRKTS